MAYVEKDKMKIYNKAQREKYKQYSGKIDKEIAKQFDEKLRNNNLTFTEWLKNNIKRYLQNF